MPFFTVASFADTVQTHAIYRSSPFNGGEAPFDLAHAPHNYGGQSHHNHSWTYIGTRKRCGACSLRPQCTSAAFRCLVIHQHEPARQRARELVDTPEFAKAQRQRKKVEALFAELKDQIGLRRSRLRRLGFVREPFFLAATAQNIKRLVRFLSQPVLPATT